MLGYNALTPAAARRTQGHEASRCWRMSASRTGRRSTGASWARSGWLELLLLLRPPPQHDRRRHGLHRRRRDFTRRCACSAPTAWSASLDSDSRTPTSTPTSIPDLNPDFIFALPGLQRPQHRDQRRHRPVAVAAARRQHNEPGSDNLRLFLENLDPARTRPISRPRAAATMPSR